MPMHQPGHPLDGPVPDLTDEDEALVAGAVEAVQEHLGGYLAERMKWTSGDFMPDQAHYVEQAAELLVRRMAGFARWNGLCEPATEPMGYGNWQRS